MLSSLRWTPGLLEAFVVSDIALVDVQDTFTFNVEVRAAANTLTGVASVSNETKDTRYLH